ncbi:hypothetical protein [Novosphingobium sp.]|jgi:hypothetical protein|uniref:hypothetical protein n=1 Tax=Novosphingobium sp. TaxID=1874826 RepID=UPI002FE0F236
MSKMLRTAGIVVAAVALVAMTAGTAAPAIAGSATAAASAGGVAGVSAATLTAVGAYGGLAASVLTAAAAATAPGVSSQGSATDFTTNPQSGLPYAMGRTRMSGLRFFAATNTRPGYTKFNDLLWFGALLSIGGQIEGIEKFTADGEVVTFDASGNAVGNFHDYMAQKVHLGGPMSTALNLSLGGGTAPGWTSAHRLSGITHAMWCLRYNKQGEMYGAGAPEPAWIGKWVKVYDPRLDSTYPGGSGSCRALDESTYVWSDNPGLHALTWALGRWQNGNRTCGIGAPVETIRMAEFVECANVCDANGWKVGGVEWTTDSKWDTLKRILQAGGARPTQTAAMIGCLVNTPRTAIATIESRHLHDGLSLAATKSRRERFNTVLPRYVDENSDWSVITGTAITVPEYVTADKGKRSKEIDFPLVQVFAGQQAKQPGQLAAYEIVNSREAGPWTFTTGPEWIGLKTGDVVYLNVPEEGLVNQPVMITRRAIDPATGKVSFAVETETYSKHAYALGQSTTPPAAVTLSAPDLKPPAPVATGWTVAGTTSGEGFPALLIAGESEMPSADAVVIDYRLHQGNETATEGWTNSAILSAADTVRHVISPLQSETRYDVRISYRVEAIDGATTIFEQVLTGVGKITTIENQLDDLAQAGKVTAHLSVPAVTLYGYANGSIADYSRATGQFKILLGTTDISSNFTFEITSNPANLTASLEGNTYAVTAGLNVDSAALTIRASGNGSYAGMTFEQVFTVSRVVAGYQIVDALPTTGNFEGRIVYNETDGKLYTYTSGAWKTGVDAADIAGEIVADQFAPNIEPVGLVTAVPAAKSTSVIFNQTDGKTYRWNGTSYVATVATSDLTGKIDATQFASGIEPVTVVTTLPTTPLTSVVSYNGKIYRWNGSAYVATVATTDLTGSIVAAQFASGIEPVTLVSGALPTTRITNVITYGGKLYRWNGAAYVANTAATDITGALTSDQIASLDVAKLAGQIIGTQITDGAISTAKLAAGSVTAAQVAAGSILASKLAIIGDNLWPDPQCQDISWWKGPTQGPLAETGRVLPTNTSNNQTSGWQCVSTGLEAFAARVGGSKGMWQLYSGQSGFPGYVGDALTQIVAPSMYCKPATAMEFAFGCTNGSNRLLRAFAQFFRADGTVSSMSTVATFSAGDMTTIIARVQFTTPADAVGLRIFWETPAAAGVPFSGFINIGNISLREAASGTMLVDGAITAAKIAAQTITAAQIASDTITAGQIAAGAISTSELAAGAVTATKMSIGDTGNLLINGNVASGNLDGWTRVYQGTGAYGSSITVDGGTNWPSNFGIRLYRGPGETGELSLVNGVTSFDDTNMRDGIDIAAGESIYFEATVWTTNTTTSAAVVEMLVRSNATSLYGSQPATALSNCTGGSTLQAKPGQGTVRISGYFTNNTGQAGKAYFRLVHTGFGRQAAAENTNIYFWNCKASRRNAGKLIVDGAITANHIASQTITAAQIAADTITAAQIAAGAVSASEIAAGAVTTSKLAVIPESIIPDPYFRDMAWWSGGRLDAGGWYTEDNNGASNNSAFNMGVPRILALAAQNNTRKHCWSAWTPFSGQGQVVRLRAMGTNPTNDHMYVLVRFYNGAGISVGDLSLMWAAGSGVSILRTGQMTVPTGTVAYEVIIFNEGTVAGNGWMLVSGVKMDIAASAEMLVDGSITAGKIAAQTITAAQIATDTITSGQIAAGAVSASEIAAGAVTAAKMTVAEYENLFLNGDLASGNLDGWSRNYNGVDGMIIQCDDGGVGTGWPSRYALHMLRNGRTGSNELSITNGLGTWDNNDKRYGIPISPGDEFAFETTCWCSNGASVQFDMIMLDTSGQLQWMACEAVQNTYLNSTTNLGAVPGEGYVVLKGTFRNVSGRQGRANVRFMGPVAATPNAHCYFWNSKMRRRNAAELIVDGNITANKLAASAVTADKISAGAVTTGKLAAGAVTAVAISAGTITASKFVTDQGVDLASIVPGSLNWRAAATVNVTYGPSSNIDSGVIGGTSSGVCAATSRVTFNGNATRANVAAGYGTSTWTVTLQFYYSLNGGPWTYTGVQGTNNGTAPTITTWFVDGVSVGSQLPVWQCVGGGTIAFCMRVLGTGSGGAGHTAQIVNPNFVAEVVNWK